MKSTKTGTTSRGTQASTKSATTKGTTKLASDVADQVIAALKVSDEPIMKTVKEIAKEQNVNATMLAEALKKKGITFLKLDGLTRFPTEYTGDNNVYVTLEV